MGLSTVAVNEVLQIVDAIAWEQFHGQLMEEEEDRARGSHFCGVWQPVESTSSIKATGICGCRCCSKAINNYHNLSPEYPGNLGVSAHALNFWGAGASLPKSLLHGCSQLD